MRPSFPDPLKPLVELAYNLRWTWNRETRDLFAAVDPELWEATLHNPVLLLRRVSRERLTRLAQDPSFLARLEDVLQHFRAALESPGWFGERYPERRNARIAYFAAEFGLTEIMPLYSGGLGVLSGDHLKSSSELAVPLTGVGLLYRHGYFTQRISAAGEQAERYPVTEFENLPVERLARPDGREVTVTLQFPGREVCVEIWQTYVGRVRLLLLDTRVEANRPEDQVITGALYAGDRETRVQQELVLGVGGMRALRELGERPDVCHMNEGHAAFLVLERIRRRMQEDGLSFEEARELTRAANVFTTHTPVPAGFDIFEPTLLRPYFESFAAELELTWEQFLSLGGSDGTSPFSMVALALNNSGRCNAVSGLHREVSRELFRSFQPAQDEAAERLESIANGVHIRSWVAPGMKDLWARHLGPSWPEEELGAEHWERIHEIPDAELWRVHGARRRKLVEWVRRRLPLQLERRGVPSVDLAWASEVLDPDALTIGWARRFATYKRATLPFRDVERLERLLSAPGRPVQLILAGKAHPHDFEGKRMIQEIATLAADPALRSRVVLLANYDMAVARTLVRGVDVWLNTPRRPLEASGTSGMKVVPNGGLNVSILDGWWAEAYDPAVGWAITGAEGEQDPEEQDRRESELLYELLEGEIVPLFYERDGTGVPARWVAKVKASIERLCPVYNTNRMVREYTERFYLPAIRGEPVSELAGASSGATTHAPGS